VKRYRGPSLASKRWWSAQGGLRRARRRFRRSSKRSSSGHASCIRHGAKRSFARGCFITTRRLCCLCKAQLARSCVAAGLKVSRRRRQRPTIALTQPFADVTGPNATWCVDFKRHFRMGNGNKLPVDAYRRTLALPGRAMYPPREEISRGRTFRMRSTVALQRYGLVARVSATFGIRCDWGRSAGKCGTGRRNGDVDPGRRRTAGSA
jgi:hypothetical protein